MAHEFVGLSETTDNGRFKIDLPSAPTGVFAELSIYATAKGKGFAVRTLSRARSQQSVDLTLGEEHAVRGQLIDLKGRPVAGARIQFNEPKRRYFAAQIEPSRLHCAISDESGRYAFTAPAKKGQFLVLGPTLDYIDEGVRIGKVLSPMLMLQQNELLRRHALGDLPELFNLILVDAAILVWLDGADSPKERPNENLAREFFELFSLGVGNYSESDIREAARALTGWVQADRDYGHARLQFDPNQFDSGEKTVFGATGA